MLRQRDRSPEPPVLMRLSAARRPFGGDRWDAVLLLRGGLPPAKALQHLSAHGWSLCEWCPANRILLHCWVRCWTRVWRHNNLLLFAFWLKVGTRVREIIICKSSKSFWSIYSTEVCICIRIFLVWICYNLPCSCLRNALLLLLLKAFPSI